MRSVTVTPADSRIGNGPEDSCRQGGKSRVTGDCHARFRGSRRVRFPPATRLAKKYVTKDGASREWVASLLRRTSRDGTKVRHETLANLSALPQATLEAVRVSLTGQALVVPGQDLEVTRAL